VNKAIIYIVFLGVFSSCDFFQNKSEEKDSKLIAKVYNFKFYEEDLRRVFPSNIDKKDSVQVASNLIQAWAKQKLLLKKSEVNMPSVNKDLEILVDRYREDLFINSFKKALVSKELDTVVTRKELVSYYEDNKESFKINEELVKFKYIALAPSDKNRVKYRRLFLSKARNDLFLLDEQQDEFESSFLSDSLWFRYKDVKNKLPVLKGINPEKVLKANYFVSKKHDGCLYYIYIKDVLYRNEIAPLRYVSKTIEQMVVQQRKLQLVHKVEEVLVDDAIKNKQFEIY